MNNSKRKTTNESKFKQLPKYNEHIGGLLTETEVSETIKFNRVLRSKEYLELIIQPSLDRFENGVPSNSSENNLDLISEYMESYALYLCHMKIFESRYKDSKKKKQRMKIYLIDPWQGR